MRYYNNMDILMLEESSKSLQCLKLKWCFSFKTRQLRRFKRYVWTLKLIKYNNEHCYQGYMALCLKFWGRIKLKYRLIGSKLNKTHWSATTSRDTVSLSRSKEPRISQPLLKIASFNCIRYCMSRQGSSKYCSTIDTWS